jgi:oligopeptide/dipeptide ABC transporter ATP-binding protein
LENLLEVKDLHCYFDTERGTSFAVEGVNFRIRQGETFGLVGESGCGKTVTALSLLRLIRPPGKIRGGEVVFNGRNLLGCSEDKMRELRGKEMGMIFQEPMTSLNPVYNIGYQLREVIQVHLGLKKVKARQRTLELLEKVRIPSPETFAFGFPHQFSGGMRQRAMIAIALACDPKLVIADEPTTALDVTIQAQILTLFNELKKNTQMSILLITHDLAVIGEVADRVAVMYAGRIIEEAPVKEIFFSPLHPYTQGLLECMPGLETGRQGRLPVIQGEVPSPDNKPSGCPFHPRCRKAKDRCKRLVPVAREIRPEHWVSCHEVN